MRLARAEVKFSNTSEWNTWLDDTGYGMYGQASISCARR